MNFYFILFYFLVIVFFFPPYFYFIGFSILLFKTITSGCPPTMQQQQLVRKRPRIEKEEEEETTIAGLPNEIWKHILAFAIEWLNLAFVCRDFYDIFDQIYYEPKRRLAPRARVKATEVGTQKFIALIGQIQPINFDLLGWARDAIGDIAEGRSS